MRLRRILLYAIILVAAPAARAEAPAEAVHAMVDAEKRFYEMGQEKGTRAAFFAFLADDGIVFRPGPVNGQEAWSKRPESGLDLVWEPTLAVIARSADFGYDTGPAKWRPNKKEEKFNGHGHFVSVWRKQKDGLWKVALDLGIENPEPTSEAERLRVIVPENENGGKTDSTVKQRALQDAQNGFAALAKLDFAKAFREFASSEVRLYRNGSFPALGRDAGTKLLGSEQAGVSMEVMKSDISNSADLAYCYGKYSDTRPQGARAGHYFQIWRTDAVGAWKLVLDWQQALPAEK